MPGLVNAHLHLFASGACTAEASPSALSPARNLHALLQGGITTAADLGAPLPQSVALRQHVGTGRSRGPRVLVAGPVLTAPDGYPIDFVGPTAVTMGLARPIASEFEAVTAVRELAEQGADLIKIALQEKRYDGTPTAMLSEAIVCALVHEAHTQELRVAAHVATRAGVERALTCHVDLLAHAPLEPLPDAVVAQLVQTQTGVAPTLFVYEAPWWGQDEEARLDTPEIKALLGAPTVAGLHRFVKELRADPTTLPYPQMPRITTASMREGLLHSHANTQRLWAAKANLGLGTDAGICFNLHGSPVEELLRLEQAGLPRAEVLRLATSGGARLLNLHDALGTVQVGFRADLLVVAGNPDEDLHTITAVKQVLIDGVEQRLGPPGFWEQAELLLRLWWVS